MVDLSSLKVHVVRGIETWSISAGSESTCGERYRDMVDLSSLKVHVVRGIETWSISAVSKYM